MYGYSAGTGQMTHIGVVSTFSPSHSRNNEPVRGIGFGDQIAELVPNVSEPITIQITRTALYAANIFQSLGYKSGVDGLVRSMKHHRWPFDLKEEQVLNELVQNDPTTAGSVAGLPTSKDDPGLFAILTFYEACWINSFNYQMTADTAIVAEDVTVDCTDIVDGMSAYDSDIINSGLDPFVDGMSSVLYSSGIEVPPLALSGR